MQQFAIDLIAVVFGFLLIAVVAGAILIPPTLAICGVFDCSIF